MLDVLPHTRSTNSYFFTARLADRNSDLLLREIDLLRRAARASLSRYPFRIDDIVVMPSVIHTIWTLPQGDGDVSARWRLLKSLFSRGVPVPEHRHPVTARNGEKGVWQRRFWEHRLADPDDITAHRRLIYQAPVQAGLVATAKEWPHTSLHRALKRGTWHMPLPAPTPQKAATRHARELYPQGSL